MSKVYKAIDIDVGGSFNLLYKISNASPIMVKTEDAKLDGADFFHAQARDVIEQARVDSYKMVAEAEATAKGIIAFAGKQAESELESARKAGYAEGLKQGLAVAEVQNNGVISELKTLLANISAEQEEMLEQFEKEMYFLSLDVAQKIVHHELNRNEQTFISLFSGAVKSLVDVESVKLVVGESEYPIASRNSELLMSMVNGAKNIEVVLNRTAPPGTCTIETPRGIIDASVDAQMKKITEMVDETRQLGAQE